MSILNTVETDLGKVGHAIVMDAEKVKAAIMKVASSTPAIQNDAATIELVINGVLAEVAPGAAVIAAAIEAVVSKVFSAIDALGSAAAADAMNVSLDVATVKAVKAALPSVKAAAAPAPAAV